MRRIRRLVLLLAAGAVAVLAFPAAGAADHATRPHTANMHALGHSPDFGSFLVPDGERDANSDIAFRGTLAFHGDYDGFRSGLTPVTAYGTARTTITCTCLEAWIQRLVRDLMKEKTHRDVLGHGRWPIDS